MDLERAVRPLERVTAAFGRVEKVEIKGRTVYLLLIKNPTGFNQVIQTFLAPTADRRPRTAKQIAKRTAHSVMIAVNDNFADGRDVSWLWDVAFEEMTGKGHTIVASGIRAADLALRLKYADEPVPIIEDLEAALDQVVEQAQPGDTVYVLPTYTAMLQLRERIRSRGLVAGRWM